MIEALFKKRNYLILFKIFIFGILLSNNDIDFINDRIITVYQPICKNTCFDINLNSHGNNYIGFQWLASHNLILDGKTSINSSSYSDVSYHNAVGFKLILKQMQNSKYSFSMSANKLRHTDNGNYTWLQSSFIYIKKVGKHSFQIVLDQIQIDSTSRTHINYIYGHSIFKNTFLYFGVSQPLNHQSDSSKLYSFLSLGFNI